MQHTDTINGLWNGSAAERHYDEVTEWCREQGLPEASAIANEGFMVVRNDAGQLVAHYFTIVRGPDGKILVNPETHRHALTGPHEHVVTSLPAFMAATA